ncbi:hypothetical protein ACHAWC_011709 [Mediolabrus comicus]
MASSSKTNSAASSAAPSPSSTPPPSLIEKIKTAAASSRNVLGVTNGWGVGLAHSGSYVSTTMRTSCTIPLLTEDQSTHDAISDIIRKKKMKEIAAVKAARIKQQQMKERNDDKKTKEKERARKDIRAKANIQLTEGNEQLNKLEAEKTSAEEAVLAGWNEQLVNLDHLMSQEENRELHSLKQEHDDIVGKMLGEVTAENDADRVKLAEALNEVGKNDKKRKLNSEATRDEGEIEETEVLQSAKKQKELQKQQEEINDLNRTKGQMVWLLKQVICSEMKKKSK